MAHPHPDMLHHLGRLLAQLYCHHHLAVTEFTKAFLRDHLMRAIADYWHFAYELLPGEETFYRAMHYGQCGSATLEKLALLYFAAVEKWNPEQVQAAILGMMKRKKLALTPYWNRFAKKYRHLGKNQKRSALPAHLHHWLAHLSDKDYNRLAKEIAKRKEKEQRAKGNCERMKGKEYI